MKKRLYSSRSGISNLWDFSGGNTVNGEVFRTCLYGKDVRSSVLTERTIQHSGI